MTATATNPIAKTIASVVTRLTGKKNTAPGPKAILASPDAASANSACSKPTFQVLPGPSNDAWHISAAQIRKLKRDLRIVRKVGLIAHRRGLISQLCYDNLLRDTNASAHMLNELEQA